jgi:hypothetical protein
MPASKSVYIGVWENSVYIGVIMFSHGASDAIGKPYGLPQVNVCELTRIALRGHDAPVSKIASIAVRMLRKQSPGLRLLVSYADPLQSHHGGIYQALGWTYVGVSSADKKYIDRYGREWHSRNVSETGLKKNFKRYTRAPKPSECTVIAIPGKYKYIYPLDAAMRAQIEPLRKPYPKRVKHPSDAPVVQAGEDGAAPIDALHTLEMVT